MFKTDQKHIQAMEEIDKLIQEVSETPNDTVYTRPKPTYQL